MNNSSLADWLQRLETLHPQKIDLGLARITEVANALELLPVAVPVVTIAGTNGKGTTAAVIEAVLVADGRRPGVCSSPHLLCFNERIRIGGVEASDADIVRAFAAIDTARGATSLSYFEFATLAALLIFSWQAADVLILEVGLGGRLDAVNIVDPTVAIITSIALDHQEWLGDTRALIAREKAGILRPDVPVIVADPDPPEALFEAIAECGARPCYLLGRDFHCEPQGNGWRGRLLQPGKAPRTLPLLADGSLVPANVLAALQALVLLQVEFSDAQLEATLPKVLVPGRRQLEKVAGREYLLDVAHNPASVNKLRDFIDVTPCEGRTILLFSCMADKDIPGMIAAIGTGFSGWVLADQPGNPRAALAADIAVLLRRQSERVIACSTDLAAGFRRARRELAAGDRLVVFGSFYTVAEILPLFAGAPGAACSE